MMNKLKKLIDPKYFKICVYSGCTVIVTVVILYLIYLSGGFWSRAWSMFTAVLRPIVLGLMFAYLLSPVVKKAEVAFEERGIEKHARPLGVLVGIVLLAAFISLFLGVIIITLVQSVSSINTVDIHQVIEYVKKDFTVFVQMIQEKLTSMGISMYTIKVIFTKVADSVKITASSVLFGIIFSVYFLLDSKNISRYWKRVYHQFASTKSDAKLLQFAEDANRVFTGYIHGQFLDASLVGVLTSVGLLIGGIPNAVVIGVLTGFGNLIPYIGPVVGYMTLAIVCVATAQWNKLIIGALILAAILFIDGNVINPKLLSKNVMVHPLVVVIALIAGGAMGGLVGMIVAVPIAALIKVRLDRYMENREIALKGAWEESDNESISGD